MASTISLLVGIRSPLIILCTMVRSTPEVTDTE